MQIAISTKYSLCHYNHDHEMHVHLMIIASLNTKPQDMINNTYIPAAMEQYKPKHTVLFVISFEILWNFP